MLALREASRVYQGDGLTLRASGLRTYLPDRPALLLIACLVPTSLFLAGELRIGFLSAGEVIASGIQFTLVLFGAMVCIGSASVRAAQLLYMTAAIVLWALGSLGFLVARVLPDVQAQKLSSLAYILFDTSAGEASEFLAFHLSWRDAFAWTLLVPLAWFAWRLPRAFSSHEPRRSRFVAGLGLLAIAAAIEVGPSAPLRQPFEPLLQAMAQYRLDLASLRQASEGMAPADVDVRRPPGLDGESELLVLVLGESTTRHNMQLYGYERPTTPRLEALRPSLIVFQDVIASHSHTIPMLKELFTFADRKHPEAWKDGPTLLALFGKAGFTTWWLSNQQVFGRHESWITAFAAHADRSVFRNLWRRDQDASFDGALLEPFENALADGAKKKLIVVHLLGTHLDASRRYPPEFGFFTEASPLARSYARELSRADKLAVDAYDNAVLYNDFVVSELLRATRETAEATGGRSAFVYLSDHGEEVKHIDSFLGHTEGRGSRYMFEIPMIAWLSDGLTREMKVTSHELANRPYQTDRLIHSLLDLMQVETDRLDVASSIFSAAFRPERRIANAMDYDAWLQSPQAPSGRLAPAAGETMLRSKLWVHRTNSVEKLASVFDDYEGFEVDIVFDPSTRRFDVNHPPAPSIGLDLEAFFASHARIAEKSFWLDFKNLEDQNAEAALAEVERVTARFGIGKRVIVESPRPDLLARFRSRGFYTSYYLPRRKQFASSEEWIAAVRSGLERGSVDALSAEDSLYQELRKRMAIEHEVLVWSPRRVEELEADERVRVVLVQVRTPYDR